MTAELTASVETALKAFNEYKGIVEGIKTKVDTIAPKMDAFDEATYKRMVEDVTKGIEASQKANAALEASNARIEALQKEQDTFRAVLSRPAAGDGKSEDKLQEISRKRTKLFNDFARLKDDDNKKHFDNYMREHVTDENELKAMSVNSDPNGGYLVAPEFGGVIQTKIYESSPIRQLASVITIGTDTFEVLTDNDQASSGWVGETQSRAETTTPTLGKIVIPVNEMYAQPKVTQKMLDDASIDIEAWLAKKVADKFGRDEATAFVSGNGVLKPKGLLSYPNGTDITQQQVQQIGSGTSGQFTYSGLVNLQTALKEPYQANATFLVQRSSNFNIMTLVDGQSRPIFNMTYDKNTGLEPMILGKPVRFAADIPTAGANALAGIYGDIKEAYQIVDRMGVRVLRDPYTQKPYILFYTTRRVGGAVVNFEAFNIFKLA